MALVALKSDSFEAGIDRLSPVCACMAKTGVPPFRNPAQGSRSATSPPPREVAATPWSRYRRRVRIRDSVATGRGFAFDTVEREGALLFFRELLFMVAMPFILVEVARFVLDTAHECHSHDEIAASPSPVLLVYGYIIGRLSATRSAIPARFRRYSGSFPRSRPRVRPPPCRA